MPVDGSTICGQLRNSIFQVATFTWQLFSNRITSNLEPRRQSWETKKREMFNSWHMYVCMLGDQIRRFSSLGGFLKIEDVSQIFVHFFNVSINLLIMTKMDWATFWAFFFANSSCHPGHMVNKRSYKRQFAIFLICTFGLVSDFWEPPTVCLALERCKKYVVRCSIKDQKIGNVPGKLHR
jgi:hypothetical protein